MDGNKEEQEKEIKKGGEDEEEVNKDKKKKTNKPYPRALSFTFTQSHFIIQEPHLTTTLLPSS